MVKYINLVHFVRGVEPRVEMDLFTPAQKVVELNNSYGWCGTYLLQYDAFIRDDFATLFTTQCKESDEIGIWLEIVRPMVEAAGMKWRGREGYDWDWYVDPGFIMAYTPLERQTLIDVTMEKFRSVFGCYPKSVGSWLLDSFSVQYMTEKYGVSGFFICREQVSIDAYTLWGGNFNNGWYPSKNNLMCPAQTIEQQINAPVFRFYGNDPIYAYDRARFDTTPFDEPGKEKFLFTIEPFYGNACNMDWVRWYLETYLNSESMQFAITQLGQENSFGWEPGFGRSLTEQYAVLADFIKDKDNVKIATLSESSSAFKAAHAMTPVTANTALTDWANSGIRSIWYNSKNYRANLFLKDGQLMLRDVHMFSERYCDRYLNTPCHHWEATYDTLPVMDSYNWSKSFRAGLVFEGDFTELSVSSDGKTMTVSAVKKCRCTVTVVFNEDSITVNGCSAINLALEKGVISPKLPPCAQIAVNSISDSRIELCHNDFNYAVELASGKFTNGDTLSVTAENNIIKAKLC